MAHAHTDIFIFQFLDHHISETSPYLQVVAFLEKLLRTEKYRSLFSRIALENEPGFSEILRDPVYTRMSETSIFKA